MLRVSAPGKVILMGEHAAVYGHPALVAGIDLRTAAGVEVRSADTTEGEAAFRLELPDLGLERTVQWEQVDRFFSAARRRVDAWERGGCGDFQPLEGLGDDGAASFVLAVLGEADLVLASLVGGEEARTLRKGIRRLRIGSDAPVGAGFGSSAAVAVVTVTGVLAALVGEAAGLTSSGGLERVERAALGAERFQHGRPSGVDTAAVLRGGVLRATRRRGGLHLSPVDADSSVLGGFRVLHSGPAGESTGAVVEAVRRDLEGRPDHVEPLLERLGALSGELTESLVNGDPDRVGVLVSEGQRCLEGLGVVPEPVRRLVRRIEAAGAYAKVSGAGSRSGPGAGAVLVYDPEEAVDWREVLRGSGLEPPFEARLGVPGLIVETPLPATGRGNSIANWKASGE